MKRREFLKLAAAGIASAYALPDFASATAATTQPHNAFDPYFLQIIDGFLRNARATSPDYVACDYPDGTKLKTCCTPSGKTYVSVARMLPAMVEWQSAGRKPDVSNILLSIFQHAFDPKHPDFWGLGRSDKPVQLCVESSLVGLAAFRLKDTIIAQLTSDQKDNLQTWLASTAQVPERTTNHAWFTATNHAARLELSRTFPQFHGDEKWMLDDIKALDGLYGDGTDGWYSDAPDQPIYDFYNFYVFPTYPLFWGQLIGARYPQWNDKFRARLKLFLEKAPCFFDANGLHPLMGRSLIYRFAVVAPLILGYRENLWPHGPGMLRRIVRKAIEYHWSIGCYDEQRGKLRQTYSKDGTIEVCENYVDNGHPYWAMMTFSSLLAIPKDDPFWTAPEAPLPVEKADFTVSFAGPKMLVSGCQRTGEVKWLQSQQSPKRDYFRDKYIKLVYSSHFPFNTTSDKTHIPPDQTLVFRRSDNGVCAARAVKGVTGAKLRDNAIETHWFATLDDWKFEVLTTSPPDRSRVRVAHARNSRPARIAGSHRTCGRLLSARFRIGREIHHRNRW